MRRSRQPQPATGRRPDRRDPVTPIPDPRSTPALSYRPSPSSGYAVSMYIARLRVIVALAATVALGCGNSPSAQSPAPAPAPPSSATSGGTDPVVAEVGGRKITLSEVDAKWQEFDAAERARLTQLLYQNRRNMLELVMGDVLIADAAKAANMTPEAYTEREIAKRSQPITEAEIQKFLRREQGTRAGPDDRAAAAADRRVPAGAAQGAGARAAGGRTPQQDGEREGAARPAPGRGRWSRRTTRSAETRRRR